MPTESLQTMAQPAQPSDLPYWQVALGNCQGVHSKSSLPNLMTSIVFDK